LKIDKLLVGTLALVLVAGIGTPAFADPANLGVPTTPLTPDQVAKITVGPFAEVGDAGQLPGTAQQVQGISGAVTAITGTISNENDVDMFRLCINDVSNWEALSPSVQIDPMLSLFDKDGNGFVFNDDNVPPGFVGARIGSAGPNVPAAPQEVLLAISSFVNEPLDGGVFMINFGNFADGQLELVGTVDDWSNFGESSGNYEIILTGFDLDSCSKVGGEFLSIDSTALVLAGLQSSAIWMLPVLAVAVGAGFAAFKLRRK